MSETQYITPISVNVLEYAKLLEDPEEYLRLRMVFLANRTLYEFKKYLGVYRQAFEESIKAKSEELESNG